MKSNVRAACLNLGAGVAALIDGILLLFVTFAMASTLVDAFSAWPQFWWLGLSISILAFALIAVLVMTVFAAREGNPPSTGPGGARCLFAYLLLPLVVCAAISLVALMGTLIVRGGVF